MNELEERCRKVAKAVLELYDRKLLAHAAKHGRMDKPSAGCMAGQRLLYLHQSWEALCLKRGVLRDLTFCNKLRNATAADSLIYGVLGKDILLHLWDIPEAYYRDMCWTPTGKTFEQLMEV